MRISDWSSDVCSSDLAGLECARPRRRIVDGDHLHGVAVRASLLPVIRVAPRQGAHAGLERLDDRSEERRVGKECVSSRRSRWSPYPTNKQTEYNHAKATYSHHTLTHHNKLSPT